MPSNFNQVSQRLSKRLNEQARDAVLEGLNNAGVKSVDFLKKRAETEGIFDLGDYIRKIEYTLESNDRIAVLAIEFNAEHSFYVENGRKPGGKHPPPNEIVGWVARKFNLPGKNSSIETLKSKAKNGDSKARELLQLVYLVGRSIANNGFKGKKFAERHAHFIEDFAFQELVKQF